MNDESYIKWTSFKDSKPTVPFLPGYSENIKFFNSATFLFDIEITEGVSKGMRTVLPVYFLYGGVQDWCVPYACETIKSMFGNVIYHNWMPYPLPRLTP